MCVCQWQTKYGNLIVDKWNEVFQLQLISWICARWMKRWVKSVNRTRESSHVQPLAIAMCLTWPHVCVLCLLFIYLNIQLKITNEIWSLSIFSYPYSKILLFILSDILFVHFYNRRLLRWNITKKKDFMIVYFKLKCHVCRTRLNDCIARALLLNGLRKSSPKISRSNSIRISCHVEMHTNDVVLQFSVQFTQYFQSFWATS